MEVKTRWRRLPYLDYFEEVQPMLYLVYLGLHPAVVNHQSRKTKIPGSAETIEIGKW